MSLFTHTTKPYKETLSYKILQEEIDETKTYITFLQGALYTQNHIEGVHKHYILS